ncbi:MFS transporter [Anaerosacchariphilus polymeriproducens]|uniref:MFS transporter n=1 Tax=Anaerosacchariphilus polymeriproducens TaxID=1812858 RepID=A0A371AT93_9FIRM|nr:MFS transporter [Anaerosacchariphilus polymeriproducens]RDU22794.1 MFS transporter [Anaerosacchariphilus polymeriproducens]
MNHQKALNIRYQLSHSLYWFSNCTLYGFATVYLLNMNFDNTQVGVVLAFGNILSVFLQPVIGSFADKTSKISLKTLTSLFAFIASSLGVILIFLPDIVWAVGGLYSIMIALVLLVIPLMSSVCIEYCNANCYIDYGLARGIGSIFYAAASISLGILIERTGAQILLPIFIFVFFLLAVVMFTFQSPAKIVQNCSFTNTSGGLFYFINTYRRFSFLLIGIVCLFFYHTILNTYFINIIRNLGGNSSHLGISLSISAAMELPVMASFFYLLKKIKCSTILKISGIFFTVKTFIIILAPNIATIFFAQSIQFLSYALYTPAIVYYTNKLMKPEDKVKGQGYAAMAACVAAVFANLAGGALLDRFGIFTMLLVGTIVSCIGTLFVLIYTEDVN